MTKFISTHFLDPFSLTNSMKYSRIFGNKSSYQLNLIIPNIYSNLSNSTTTFMEALFDQDDEYIQNVTIGPIKNIMSNQIKKMKQEKISMKMGDKLNFESDNKKIQICPYVIFNCTMEQKVKLSYPWQQCWRLLSNNRFCLAFEGQQPNFSSIVYGFDIYFPMTNFQVTTKKSTEKINLREFLVTFETNEKDQQFWITDFDHIVRNLKKGQQKDNIE